MTSTNPEWQMAERVRKIAHNDHCCVVSHSTAAAAAMFHYRH